MEYLKLVIKHVKNIAKILFLYFLGCVPLTIIGWFVVPIGLLFPREFEPWGSEAYLPNHRMPKIFWIWDNYKNGIDGDIYWVAKRKPGVNWSFYCRYVWTAFRNPISNFKHWIGVDGVVVRKTIQGSIKHDPVWGHKGWTYVEVETKDGKIYPMYYLGLPIYKGKGLRFIAGWKNFNVRQSDLPKRYCYTFTINFQPYRTLL